jgi:DNA-binding transcriptional MocR family regulator
LGIAAENALYEALQVHCRMVLTPGASQHAQEPGFFRFCFAFVGPEALEVALAKFEVYVAKLRSAAK